MLRAQPDQARDDFAELLRRQRGQPALCWRLLQCSRFRPGAIRPAALHLRRPGFEAQRAHLGEEQFAAQQNSRRALLTHRAPTLDGDEKPLFGPRVQDAWEWQVPVSAGTAGEIKRQPPSRRRLIPARCLDRRDDPRDPVRLRQRRRLEPEPRDLRRVVGLRDRAFAQAVGRADPAADAQGRGSALRDLRRLLGRVPVVGGLVQARQGAPARRQGPPRGRRAAVLLEPRADRPVADAGVGRPDEKESRPNQFARMICNEFVSSESQFVDLDAWDQCVKLAGPLFRDESLPIFVGVDASTKRDSTALCAVAYQGQCVRLVAHKVFVPAPGDPINFEVTVEKTLREWHRRFHLQKILFDPYQLASTMQRLAAEGLPVEEYPQTLGNLTATTSGLFDLIQARQLALYPDAGMRLAVSRAVVSEGSRGWKIAKDKQSHHIDVVVALSMACLAAVRDGGAAAYALDLSWIDGDGEHAGLSPRALDMAEKREFAMMQMRNYVLSGGGTRLPWSY